MLEVKKTTLELAGSTRLEQLRQDMAAELTGTPERPAVEAGGGDAGADAASAKLDEIRSSMTSDNAGAGEGAATS